jgi:hypothetical protein
MRGLAADTSGPLTIAVVGAALAALGYVAKLIVAEWNQARAARNARRTSLIRLQALLRATSYEQLFSELFPSSPMSSVSSTWSSARIRSMRFVR